MIYLKVNERKERFQASILLISVAAGGQGPELVRISVSQKVGNLICVTKGSWQFGIHNISVSREISAIF